MELIARSPTLAESTTAACDIQMGIKNKCIRDNLPEWWSSSSHVVTLRRNDSICLCEPFYPPTSSQSFGYRHAAKKRIWRTLYERSWNEFSGPARRPIDLCSSAHCAGHDSLEICPTLCRVSTLYLVRTSGPHTYEIHYFACEIIKIQTLLPHGRKLHT